MIFDSHAHYDDSKFDEDREALIASLPANGIGYVVNAGSSVESLRAIMDMADKYDHMYGALGIHPCDIEGLTDNDMDWIRQQSSHNKIVAIGEIGLDYYWEEENKENQIKWFEEQLALAGELKLPQIIHSREADLATQEILKSHKNDFHGGVIHCYSYSKESAGIYLNMGYYLGIGGVITFNNARKIKEVVEYAPMDRILLETDCPYLAPVPYRGKRNSSLYLEYVVEEIARIKNVSQQEVIDITCENAKRMFGLIK